MSLLTVGVVGGFAYGSAKKALQQAVFNRLQVTATLKEQEIIRWFEDQQRDFLLITQSPDFQANLATILDNNSSDEQKQPAYQLISSYLAGVNQVVANLDEIFVINPSSRIIVSTNKTHEGQYETLANVTYFEHIEQGKTFAPIFYVSPLTGKPAITLATPVRNSQGKRQGVILAHLNLNHIDQIVRESSGSGNSGETYLVGSLLSKNTFISRQADDNQQLPPGVSSKGIDAAMSGDSGADLYRNYAGVPVLGVYRWLNDRDIALLVEMHQSEAFAPARKLATTIVLVGLMSAGVLFTGVLWLSRQLSFSRQQLETKAQEANAANRAKSEFLANMSHELRTPLNAILGFSQLMARDPSLTSENQDSLAIINRSGEHLLNLINDVLEMSKIEAGKTVLNCEPFDLIRLLQTLREMFQMRAASKGLSLDFDLAADLPSYINSDEGKLRQVLINLLGNAVKFTATGGVTLRVEVIRGQRNTVLNFAVIDTGKGIEAQEIDQLFQPFVQTASGVKSQGGTGLGLVISRRFVQLMGGDIQVVSTLGKGSVFHFDIPVELAPPMARETLSPSQRILQMAPGQPEFRILIVDDRQENRKLLTQLLSRVGLLTRSATNGLEAITLWQDWQPHLIWMDMRMPIMDGYEATRRIRAYEREKFSTSHTHNQATKIIALTATAFEEQRHNILAAGCDDVVHKPFSEELIFAKIAQYLGVQYIYEQPQDDSLALNREQNASLHPDDLDIMATEWIRAVYQAAIQVDADLLNELINQIPETHQFLKGELTRLVSNYEFDAIVDLTGQM